MSDASPWLSVVVASAASVRDLEACLSALAQQDLGRGVEIIVADCCQDEARQDLTATYPYVTWSRFSSPVTLPGLWGAGIARATGQIIAITETTCVVDHRWVATILQAHEGPHAVIGGAVEVEGRRSLVDWAAYFCEYGQFMLPLVKGVVHELPGNNVSFKRWVLQHGQEYVQPGFWKTYWCRKLQAAGIELVAAPAMVVHYKKTFRLRPFLIRRFHHGRCFAGMRIAQDAALKRVFYALASPLLPLVFLYRIITAIVPKKRYLKEFVLSLPVSCLAIVSWSCGECWGYLTGPGDSCKWIY